MLKFHTLNAGVVGVLTECGDLESEKFEACWAPLLNGARVCFRRKPWRSQTFVLRRANIYVIYMRRGVLAMAGTKRATKVILSAAA
jgi:hypothetical protein